MGGKRKDMTTTFYEFFFKLSCTHAHKDGTDNIEDRVLWGKWGIKNKHKFAWGIDN